MKELPEGKDFYGFGRTVEEAIEDALAVAGVSRDKVTIEVLDEGAKGIFGLLGTRLARVKVIVPEELLPEEKQDSRPPALTKQVAGVEPKKVGQREVEPAPHEVKPPLVPLEEIPDAEARISRAVSFLEGLLQHLGINEGKVMVQKQEGMVTLEIAGEHLGLVIGRRGETLNAIQYLTNLVANKGAHQMVKFILDAEGYRQRREEALQHLGQRMARKVKLNGRKAVLEPMTPQERRVIHLALQNDPDVYTYSEGEEPYRRVVIDLKKKPRRENRRGARE